MVFPAISKNFKSVIGEIFSGTSVPRPNQHYFRSPKRQASPSLLVMSITFDLYARSQNCSLWKCELKPSEHACKIFFNYSKLCVISIFAKRVYFLPPKTCFSNEFSQHYWLITKRIPWMVIPLLANQDLMPMLSQSRFDAYACY